MKKVLLYGMCGMDNLGDDWMYYAIDGFLSARNCSIEFVSRMNWKAYFSEEIVPKCAHLPIYETESIWLEQRVKKYLPFLKKTYDKLKYEHVQKFFDTHHYEALIFLGGGYITSNETVMSIDELENMFLLVNTARKCGMKIVFSGLTVGPFQEGGRAENLAKEIFKLADAISVREKYSYNELKHMGINSVLTGDNIFLLAVEKAEKPRHILVNLKAHKEQSSNIERLIKEIVDLCKKESLPIVVMSFRSARNSEEYMLNKRFSILLQEYGIQSEMLVPGTVQQLMELYRGAQFVIGSAYHSVALSMLFNKKIYTWYKGRYYTYKIRGLLELFSLNDSIEDKQILEAYNGSEDLLEKVRKTVWNEWNDIVEMLE